MYRGTPYVNRHIKRREQERSMDYHANNLSRVRPLTHTLDGGEVSINNKKGEMQKEARFTEIERENRILLEKISGIMGKPKRPPAQQNSQPRINGSLNSSFRRRQMQSIEIENAKLLKRLQERKANYETEKFRQSWRKQKSVIKNMSQYPFIIDDRKRKKNSSTQLGPSRNSRGLNVELSKIKTIDGVSFLVTIRMGMDKLQIIGDTKTKKDIKVIEINRKEAIEFIELQCDGRLENVFDRLRYDKVDEVLYLVARDFDVEDLKRSPRRKEEQQDGANPEFDDNNLPARDQWEAEDGQQQREAQEEEPIKAKLPESESAKKYWVQKKEEQEQRSEKQDDYDEFKEEKAGEQVEEGRAQVAVASSSNHEKVSEKKEQTQQYEIEQSKSQQRQPEIQSQAKQQDQQKEQLQDEYDYQSHEGSKQAQSKIKSEAQEIGEEPVENPIKGNSEQAEQDNYGDEEFQEEEVAV